MRTGLLGVARYQRSAYTYVDFLLHDVKLWKNFKQMKQPTLAGLLLTLACLFIAYGNQAQIFQVQQQEEGVLLQEGGKNILFFQQSPKSLEGKYARSNYVHPLYSLDGEILTEDFPADHLHHRGIFWAWHEILIGGKKVGDAWDCDNISWDVRKVIDRLGGGTATITTKTFWQSTLTATDAKPTKIFKEKTSIEVYPTTATYRVIDFTIKLKPLLKGMAIGGSTDTKGYGGFSPRIKLPNDIRFISQEGEVEAQRDGLDAGPWMDMIGSFDGKQRSGVTMMMHPSFPQAPQKWILRAAKSMQNAAFPGNKAYSLEKGQWLEMRYRMVLHREEVGEEVLSKLYQEFVQE